jgi:uroporphyrinogen-III synthase
MIHIVPMQDNEPIDRAIRSLDSYDWLVFTSVNGVKMFWQRLVDLLDLKSRDLVLPKIAAVGPATAKAISEWGVQPEFIPEEFVGEAVASGLDDLAGLRILLPRAEIGRKGLTSILRSRGGMVEDLPVYRTLPAAADASALAELRAGVDAVLFTSSSALRNWATTVDGGDGSYLVACIGPVTAGTARELGMEPDIVATEYTTEGLVQALVNHFRGQGEERADAGDV